MIMDYDKLARDSCKIYRKPRVKPVFDTIDIERLYELGEIIKDKRIRALYFIMYLSGARVSEALNLRARDIRLTDSGEFVITILTLKNREHPKRSNPVLYNANPKHEYYHHYEKKMVDFVIGYISGFNPDDKLFNMTRQSVFNKFTHSLFTHTAATHGKTIIDDIEKRINPHYLRHCRLTHLVQEYGYTEIPLMIFAGWSNTDMCRTYIHIGFKNLANEMKK